MPDPTDQLHLRSTEDLFFETTFARQHELEFMMEQVAAGLEVAADLEEVNRRIVESERPDLVISDRVEIAPYGHPYAPERINNFPADLSGFGSRIEDDRSTPSRAKLTEEEKAELIILGGRGDSYDEIIARAASLGIDKERAVDMGINNSSKHQAFMRMWMLFPDFTDFIIESCRSHPDKRAKSNIEEYCAAYLIMSQLVDVNDKGTLRHNGEFDPRFLFR